MSIAVNISLEKQRLVMRLLSGQFHYLPHFHPVSPFSHWLGAASKDVRHLHPRQEGRDWQVAFRPGLRSQHQLVLPGLLYQNG